MADEGDVAAVVVEVEGGDFFVVDVDAASKRVVEALEEGDGGGFAAAGGADEGDVLAWGDGEVRPRRTATSGRVG